MNKNNLQGSPNRYITQSEFAESQLQEIYKFLGKVHSKSQQLISLKIKPIIITIDKNIGSELYNRNQKKIVIDKRVSDFTNSQFTQMKVDNPGFESTMTTSFDIVEVVPVAVMHRAENETDGTKFDETKLEM